MHGFDRREAKRVRLFPDAVIRRRRRREADLGKGRESRTFSEHAFRMRPGAVDDEDDEGSGISDAVAEKVLRAFRDINGTLARKKRHAEIFGILEEALYRHIRIEFGSGDEYGVRQAKVGEASRTDGIFPFLRMLEEDDPEGRGQRTDLRAEADGTGAEAAKTKAPLVTMNPTARMERI